MKLVLYFDKDEKKNDSLTEPTIQIDMNETRENGGDGGIFTIQHEGRALRGARYGY